MSYQWMSEQVQYWGYHIWDYYYHKLYVDGTNISPLGLQVHNADCVTTTGKDWS